MKYVIIYMSHHGTTATIAEQMAGKIGDECTTLINLKDNSSPEIDHYDFVIIGGSIHMGKIQKPIADFCKQHQNELLQKKLALFLCMMNKEHGQEVFDANFDEKLRMHSISNGIFGGELLIDKMSFFEKLIVKTITGEKETVHAIDQHAINEFVDRVTAVSEISSP